MDIPTREDSSLWPVSGESLEKHYLQEILKISEPFASFQLIENSLTTREKPSEKTDINAIKEKEESSFSIMPTEPEEKLPDTISYSASEDIPPSLELEHENLSQEDSFLDSEELPTEDFSALEIEDLEMADQNSSEEDSSIETTPSIDVLNEASGIPEDLSNMDSETEFLDDESDLQIHKELMSLNSFENPDASSGNLDLEAFSSLGEVDEEEPFAMDEIQEEEVPTSDSEESAEMTSFEQEEASDSSEEISEYDSKLDEPLSSNEDEIPSTHPIFSKEPDEAEMALESSISQQQENPEEETWLQDVQMDVEEISSKDEGLSLEEQIENLLARVVTLQEQEVQAENLLSEKRRELEDVLMKVDVLIEKLPKNKALEFEKKKYQSLYGKVYDHLGI